MIEQEVTKSDQRLEGIASGGLIAISLIIIQAFISMGKLDFFALASMVCFAIGLPLLACTALVAYVRNETQYNGPILERTLFIIFIVGGGLDGAGIWAAFSHISVLVGFIFLACCLIMIPIFTRFDNYVRRGRKSTF